MDQGDNLRERGIPTQDAIKIIANRADHIVETKGSLSFGLEGAWYPIYLFEPKITIQNLHLGFMDLQKLASKYHGSNVGLLDAGSGMGLACDTAQYSGFSRVYGVEYNPKISALAQVEKDYFLSQGLTNLQHTTLLQGSYYLPENVEKIKQEWIIRHRLNEPDTDANYVARGDALTKLPILFQKKGPYPESSKDIMSGFDEIYPPTNLLRDAELVRDGTLTVPVVFSFGSDPFYLYESGFVRQMATLLPDNGLFVIQPTTRTVHVRQILLESSFVEEPTIVHGRVKLITFRKLPAVNT